MRTALACGLVVAMTMPSHGQAIITPGQPAYALRVLNVNTTATGTPATLVETDLWTYTLPANTLSADGKSIRITVYGLLANNANTKTTRIVFGNQTIKTDVTTIGNSAFWFTATVTRTSATAQISNTAGLMAAAVRDPTITTPAETMANAIVVKVTGQNSVAVANDIVFRGAIVELLP